MMFYYFLVRVEAIFSLLLSLHVHYIPYTNSTHSESIEVELESSPFLTFTSTFTSTVTFPLPSLINNFTRTST